MLACADNDVAMSFMCSLYERLTLVGRKMSRSRTDWWPASATKRKGLQPALRLRCRRLEKWRTKRIKGTNQTRSATDNAAAGDGCPSDWWETIQQRERERGSRGGEDSLHGR